MALEIPVQLQRVNNLLIDYRPRRTVAASVTIVRVLGEESHVVALADYNHSNAGVDFEILACL